MIFSRFTVSSKEVFHMRLSEGGESIFVIFISQEFKNVYSVIIVRRLIFVK